MITLYLLKSKTSHEYKTKKEALKEIKDNGLRHYDYVLVNDKNNTQYKSGSWFSAKEMEMLSNGYSIRYIKSLRITITFDKVSIGDTINYDLSLDDLGVKNETMLILDKNDTHIKLHSIRNTWLCSERFFNTNLLNVKIIREG